MGKKGDGEKLKLLSDQANGILKEFGAQKLCNLLEDVYGSEEHKKGILYSMLDLFTTSEDLEAELDSLLQGELHEVRLLATAMLISRLADRYGRVLKKITTKYPNFHNLCKKINGEVNGNRVP